MVDKVTFKVSSSAAPYLGADKPREDRLQAAMGSVRLPPTDLVLVLYYLCHDPDPEVKRAAMASLRGLDLVFLCQLLLDRELHPRILDVLVQLHFNKTELTALFAAHPMLSEKAATYLVQKGALPCENQEGACRELGEYAGNGPAACADEDGPIDEQSTEFQSKFQLSQGMAVGDKIKAALTGDKEWRCILIKDSNKLVSVSVVRNPRISDGEVLTIAKSAVQNEEIMRVICANKEWVKNPLIRKALAENNKTPIPAALRFVATLSEKDLSQLARSKNVASVVASQARRLLMNKKDGR